MAAINPTSVLLYPPDMAFEVSIPLTTPREMLRALLTHVEPADLSLEDVASLTKQLAAICREHCKEGA